MKNYKVWLMLLFFKEDFLGGEKWIKYQKITFMLSKVSFNLS